MQTIGIGRLISKKLLELINYKPFDDNKNCSMDRSMYKNCINNNMKIKIIKNESIFLSVSCDLWNNMHNFNYHYDMLNNNYEKYIIINDHNFIDYVDLYKNGYIHTTDELNEIKDKFPEISSFYKDYSKIKNI